jgi:hypothetical protein
VRPFLLEDGDKDEVEFIEERSLGFEGIFRARGLDDKADHEVSNAWTNVNASHKIGRIEVHLDTAPLVRPSILS